MLCFLRRVSRDKWRRMADDFDKIKIVFIVAITEDDTEDVLKESEAEGDILFPSLRDGHDRLSYKVLSGYVWSYLHCSRVRFVGKTDDNVVVDLARLMSSLETFPSQQERFFACGTPVRNTRWIRPSKGHITSVWSADTETVREEKVPDWCVGWLYLTTPKVGAEIVQAGHAIFPDTELNLPEDHLIAGLLRETVKVHRM